jgi:transcriptional regulator with XRE-family HTH domain
MNLRAERIDRGLSLAEAGELMGVDRRTLNKAEEGVMPQPAKAKRIADFFGVRVTDIWPVEDSDTVAA